MEDDNINKVYRIPISINDDILENIKSFLNYISDELEPVDLKHECVFNNCNYKLKLYFRGVKIKEFNKKVCGIKISIYKDDKIFFNDKVLIYDLSDLYRIMSIQPNNKEIFLIKLVEDTNNNLMIFKQTFENLTKSKFLDEDFIKTLILYNSLTNKIEGMSICFSLLFKQNLLIKSKEIQKLLLDKLEYMGYDESVLDIKTLKNDSSYNVYINTLTLIAKILYKKKDLTNKESRDIALKKLNLFKDLLKAEKYFKIK